jgi:hypothetical protein
MPYQMKIEFLAARLKGGYVWILKENTGKRFCVGGVSGGPKTIEGGSYLLPFRLQDAQLPQRRGIGVAIGKAIRSLVLASEAVLYAVRTVEADSSNSTRYRASNLKQLFERCENS